jgi:hypothetical protein
MSDYKDSSDEELIQSYKTSRQEAQDMLLSQSHKQWQLGDLSTLPLLDKLQHTILDECFSLQEELTRRGIDPESV